MLTSLYPSILYRHILPLSRLCKHSASAHQTLWDPGYDEKHFIYDPLLTWPTYMSNQFDVGRGPQIYKNGLAMEVTIGGDAEKLSRTFIC